MERRMKKAAEEIDFLKICYNSKHDPTLFISFWEMSVIGGDVFDFHYIWCLFQVSDS